MCLNQIFQDEQLALMGYSRATGAIDLARWQRHLCVITAAFQSFPYPHRPFVWRAGTEQDTH
jgi:hypothetical protein